MWLYDLWRMEMLMIPNICAYGSITGNGNHRSLFVFQLKPPALAEKMSIIMQPWNTILSLRVRFYSFHENDMCASHLAAFLSKHKMHSSDKYVIKMQCVSVFFSFNFIIWKMIYGTAIAPCQECCLPLILSIVVESACDINAIISTARWLHHLTHAEHVAMGDKRARTHMLQSATASPPRNDNKQ